MLSGEQQTSRIEIQQFLGRNDAVRQKLLPPNSAACAAGVAGFDTRLLGILFSDRTLGLLRSLTLHNRATGKGQRQSLSPFTFRRGII